jgi:DNA-binding response OmpR family regulator
MRGRILVADDEPHIRRILSVLLTEEGFDVAEALDGGDALRRIDSDEHFDLFLLDLRMPKATGLEVLARIRAHPTWRHTPIIMLTAKGQDTDRREALAGGADDFFTKPFSPKKLIARIRELLLER